MKHAIKIAGSVLLLVVLIVCPCCAANVIYARLIDQGVELSPKETIKLPLPVLADGLNQTQQQHAIETSLAGKYDWETFTRRSLVAPSLLKIEDEGRETGSIGRRVELYFVTYGSLKAISGDNYLQDQLNIAAADDQSEDRGRVKVLTVEELRARGLPAGQSATDPKWVAIDSTLLNKVRISLTTQNLKTETSESVLIASIADPRFATDSQYPNCWRSLSTDDAGNRQVGAPQPYSGLGAYAKITQLLQPEGAIFVEYHVAFAEPADWFHGTNLLRSKLPIVAQDMVRKLRHNTSEHP